MPVRLERKKKKSEEDAPSEHDEAISSSAGIVLRWCCGIDEHCRKSWLEEDAEGFSRSTTVECQNVTYSLVELSLVGGREKKKITLEVCLFFETVR